MSIVGGEEDDGVVVDALRLQFGHDESNVVVEHLDHRGVFFFGQREGGVVGEVGMKFGDGDGAVGKLGGVIKEKGFFLILANEFENALDEDVLGIGLSAGTHGFVSSFAGLAAGGIVIAGKLESFAIAPEIGRVEAMATLVIVVAFVEVPAKAFHPFMPGEEAAVEFAELGGAVAGLLGDLGEEDFVFGNGVALCFQFGEAFLVDFFGNLSGIALDGESGPGLGPATAAAVMESGEECPAGGGTVDAAVVVGELDALLRQSVNVRSLDELLAIAPQHSRAQVVREDEDDVGFGLG